MHTITLTAVQKETLRYVLEQNIDDLKAMAYDFRHMSSAQQDVLRQIGHLNGVLELMEHNANTAIRRHFELAVTHTMFVNINAELIGGEELTDEVALSILEAMPADSNDYRAHGLDPREYFEDWVAGALRELVSDLAMNAHVAHDKLMAEDV